MTRIALAVLFAAAAACAAIAQDADRGLIDANNNLSSKLGRFAVTLPAGFGPYTFTEQKKTSDGDDNMVINQYSSDGKRGTWMIGYYDLSAKLLADKTTQKILDDAQDGSVKAVSGSLKRDDAITVDGFPGKSFYVEIVNGDKTIYARDVFVLAKLRVYNFLFLSVDESELYKPDVKKYFDSFHITN
ncbi:MAG TPA: hypothetical protein VGI80_01035 [Pyrinomonadaceae bacterium]|jgi:hypothetical protein